MATRQMSVEEFHGFFCERSGAALDGSWFGACKSTRIYCRPTCGVHPPKIENLEVFPSCAAAEQAGYRPCLSCCPESAPKPSTDGMFNPKPLACAAIIERYAAFPHCIETMLDASDLTHEEADTLFIDYYDVTVEQFAQTAKRLNAKRMLRETALSPDEVASKCGYADADEMRNEFNARYRLDVDKLAAKKPYAPRISRRKAKDESGENQSRHLS